MFLDCSRRLSGRSDLRQAHCNLACLAANKVKGGHRYCVVFVCSCCHYLYNTTKVIVCQVKLETKLEHIPAAGTIDKQQIKRRSSRRKPALAHAAGVSVAISLSDAVTPSLTPATIRGAEARKAVFTRLFTLYSLTYSLIWRGMRRNQARDIQGRCPRPDWLVQSITCCTAYNFSIPAHNASPLPAGRR
jgi:hypothetical protein